MRDDGAGRDVSRREALGAMGKVAVASVVASPLVEGIVGVPIEVAAQTPPLNAAAGVDRIALLPGKTYLNAWVGYGEPPRRTPPAPHCAAAATPADGPCADIVLEQGVGAGPGDLRRRRPRR